jgi:hypothetical protein
MLGPSLHIPNGVSKYFGLILMLSKSIQKECTTQPQSGMVSDVMSDLISLPQQLVSWGLPV